MAPIDDDVERRHDLSMPPPRDLGVVDLSGSGDLAMSGGDMSMGRPDLAMGSMDLAMSSGDMSMGRPDLAMGGDMSMGRPDLAMGGDMAMGGVDMSMGDMSMGGVDLAMGGMDMSSSRDMTRTYTCRGADAPGTVYQLVTDSLHLPTGAIPYTYDFDGSARLKNQLKTFLQAISLAGLDLQTPVDAAVKNGTTLQLASLTTNNLMSSLCTGVSIVPAKPTLMPPMFDGTDTLERTAVTPADLIGTLTAGKLSTKASKDLLATEDGVLELRLSIGAMALALPIHGLHVEGTVERLGMVTRIRNGVIHGVVAASDIDTKLFPAIADLVTNLINSDPMSSITKTIISLLENTANPVSATKCMVAANCCKTSPATCFILPAEVKISLIGTLLVPDVQVFDTMGQWKPVPRGTMLNGMTVGIGFTGVTATYP
jgi:hypothetical protein